MNVVINKRAFNALNSIALWVEMKNTTGSGVRWLNNFLKELDQYAQSNTTYALCRNEALQLKKYSCINIDGWIIAHKIVDNNFYSL